MEKPSLYLIQGQDLPLSGTALLELMREVLERGVPFRFQAKGWSMSPFIRNGDVITIAPLFRSQCRLGEVVTVIYPKTGELLVHRVVGKGSRACLIQGDNLSGENDGWIPTEKILGRVISVERKGKSIRVGLGPERYGIAFFSRIGLLSFSLGLYGRIKKLRGKVEEPS